MEIDKLESVLEYVTYEVNKQIEFDVSVLAIFSADTNDLKIVTQIEGKQQCPKIISNSIFHAFQILNGSLFVISKQNSSDNNSFMDRIINDQNQKKIRASFVIPINHEKLGNGAILLGSYTNGLLSDREKVKRFNLHSMISKSFEQLVGLTKNDSTINTTTDYFQKLFVSSMNAAAVIDANGTIILANHKLEKLTGFSLVEIENRMSIDDFLSISTKNLMLNSFQSSNIVNFSAEFDLVRKNGEDRIVDITVDNLADSQKFVVNFTDVTQYKSHEVEIKEWGEKFNKINELITIINSHINLDQLLKSLFTQLSAIFEFNLAAIILCDTITSEVQIFLSENNKPIQIKTEGAKTHSELLNYLSTKKKVEIGTELINQLFNIIDTPIKTKIESQICIKLQTKNNILGTFCIASDINNAYSQFHIDILHGVADQVAIAIIKMKLFQQYQRSLENFSQLHKISESLNGSLDLEKILKLIAKSTYNVTGANFCSIKLIENDLVNHSKIKHGFKSKFNNKLTRRIQSVIDEKQPLIIENISSLSLNNRKKSKKQYLRSFCIFPIILKNKTIALLYIFFKKVHIFTTSEIELIKSLTQQAALAIDKAKRYRNLKNSKEYLESFLKYSGDAIVSTTLEGNIIFFNDRAEKNFGYTREEVLGNPIYTIMVNGRSIFTNLRNKLLNSNKIQNLESEVLKKDGSFIPVNWSFSLLKNNNEKITGFLGFGKDASDQNQLENEIKQKNEQLENLIYSVSHNLKTPLVSQEGFISLLQNEYFDQLDDEGKHYITRIKRNIKYMEEMINDLLRFFKIRQQNNNSEYIETKEVLQSIINDINYNNKIEISFSNDLPTVYFNKEELKTIFSNLISNAVKYSGNGTKPQIDIYAEQKENYHYFYVKDNGIGIDEKYHRQVFDIFYRLHGVKEIEGTGMGLAIVRRIVENHNGTIGIDSSPGKGTTINFSIPNQDKPEPKRN